MGDLLSKLVSPLVAILLLVVAFVVAAIAKSLVMKLLKALKLDNLLSKVGVKEDITKTAIDFIGKLVYFIVFLLFLPTVLNKLGMQSVSAPITNMVNQCIGFIPNLIAAGIIIVVGVFIANIVRDLLASVLKVANVDALQAKAGFSAKVSFAKIISEVVKYILVVIFVVQGINVLGLPVLSNIGSAIIGYMPAVIAAVIIFALGMFAANVAATAITKMCPNGKVAALVVKVVIYVFVGFVCLNQLGVAIAIVEETFTLIVTALCIAFAIAFGVGGRTFAANMLAKLEKKMENEEK